MELETGEKMKEARAFLGVFVCIFFFGPVSFSQTNPTNQISTSLPTAPSIFSQPALEGGFRSWDDSGRIKELQDPSGRQLKSKNEYFIGVKSKAGWGVIAQAVEYGLFYGDGSRNYVSPGDPSFSIQHPVYESRRLQISGMFREYFPVSNYSVTNNIWQQAYYSYLLYKMPHEWDLANILIPRYYSAAQYNEIPGKSPDPTFFTEDYFFMTRQVAKWFRYGAGLHTQVECHSIAPVGKTVDFYPLADFMLSHNVYIGPRIYFPVAAQNSVIDGDTAVSTTNIQAEIYLQATL